MKDFIHKSLLSAGSKDAVTNMMQGAGIGAVANVGLGAVQGDFDVIGNATSGALLGAGGGAAARHFGSKYASGMNVMGKEAPNTFSTTVFTKANKEEYDFWGNNTDILKRNQGMYDKFTESQAAKKPSGTPVKEAPKKFKDMTVEKPNESVDMTVPNLHQNFDIFGNAKGNIAKAGTVKSDSVRAPISFTPYQGSSSTFANTKSSAGTGASTTKKVQPTDYTQHAGFGSLGKAHQEVLKKYPNEVPTEKPDGMSAAAFKNLISTHRNAVTKLGKYKE